MNRLSFSYLKLNDGLLNKKFIKTTTTKDDVRILKSLLKSISKETYSVPTRLQEIKYCTDISLTTSKSRGEFEVIYAGYGYNMIKINLSYGTLRMKFNDSEVIYQYCGNIDKKDIETITKAFKVLSYAKTIIDIRDSKMFSVLQ